MAEMKKKQAGFVIGIDSGGTNYRVKACGPDGKCLGYEVGEPANHHYLNEEEMRRRIDGTIDRCLGQFGGERSQIQALACGTTGIDGEEDLERLRKLYTSLRGIACPVALMNDAELAHYAVTGGKGVLMLAGTGSIAVGRRRDGKTARAGGWPLAILGDEGSGAWVTKMALRHMGRRLDQAVEETELTREISSLLSIKTRDDLIRLSLESGLNPAGLPQLGGIVEKAAEHGDLYARDILLQAAEELAGIADDVVRALDLDRVEPEFLLGLWGSSLLKSEITKRRFLELMRERHPGARPCFPEKEAVDGAVELALETARKEKRI